MPSLPHLKHKPRIRRHQADEAGPIPRRQNSAIHSLEDMQWNQANSDGLASPGRRNTG